MRLLLTTLVWLTCLACSDASEAPSVGAAARITRDGGASLQVLVSDTAAVKVLFGKTSASPVGEMYDTTGGGMIGTADELTAANGGVYVVKAQIYVQVAPPNPPPMIWIDLLIQGTAGLAAGQIIGQSSKQQDTAVLGFSVLHAEVSAHYQLAADDRVAVFASCHTSSGAPIAIIVGDSASPVFEMARVDAQSRAP